MAGAIDFIPKRLAQWQPGTSYASGYGAAGPVIVKEIIACNTTAGAVSLWVSIVISGGSAGAGSEIITNHAIPAYTTVIYELAQPLGQFDDIEAKASAATSITITMSGVEYTF
jgi:hypothetical protein